MKNGLPSERRWIRRNHVRSAASPVIAASSAAVSSVVEAREVDPLMRPVRSSSPSHGSAGCRR